MTLAARLRLLVLASVGAVVVTWPMVGFGGREGAGFSFAVLPALRLGLWTFGIGLAAILIGEVQGALGPAAGRAVAPIREAARAPAVGGSALLLLVGALAAVPAFAGDYWTGLLLEAFVYVTIASGLNITIGMAGLLVLGHAAFWAVGAYAFAMLSVHAHWNFWPAFAAAGAAAAAAGFVIGLPALRLRGDYLAVVTLGFGEVVRRVLKNESEWTGGDAGIPGSEVRGDLHEIHGPEWLWQPGGGVDADVRRECYWFALGLAVVCVASIAILRRSRWGRALFALREDETAARCMGIDATRIKLLAFTSSAMWAGLAGVVHPIYYGQATPDFFDFNASVLCLAMVVLGGLGSLAGPVIGAVLLWIAPALLRNHFPEFQEYRLLVFGMAMVATMVVRPQGLVGAPTAKSRPAGAAA